MIAVETMTVDVGYFFLIVLYCCGGFPHPVTVLALLFFGDMSGGSPLELCGFEEEFAEEDVFENWKVICELLNKHKYTKEITGRKSKRQHSEDCLNK
jgi:hypothetical protein